MKPMTGFTTIEQSGSWLEILRLLERHSVAGSHPVVPVLSLGLDAVLEGGIADYDGLLALRGNRGCPGTETQAPQVR